MFANRQEGVNNPVTQMANMVEPCGVVTLRNRDSFEEEKELWQSRSRRRADAVHIQADGREPDDEIDDGVEEIAFTQTSQPADAAYRLVRNLFSLPDEMDYTSTKIVVIIMVMAFTLKNKYFPKLKKKNLVK